MRTIYYWPDGTWCDKCDLPYMNHLSDDFGMVEVSWDADENEIDRIVKAAADGPL